jgi:signal transduction histidine kinase
MTTSTTAVSAAPSPSPWWTFFLAGFRCSSWRTVALILAINTGIALLLFTEETRPFWHPFISAQSIGLSIAYMVNAAQPWEAAHPMRRLIAAVAGGTVIGMAILFTIKGYIIGDPEYLLPNPHGHGAPGQAVSTALSSMVMGTCISLFFLLKIRDAMSRAAILKAEADRNLLSKQAVEAELKLMQAQVEPHFLFNTLASVQFLTETDPPKAGQMLGHLLAYLRAALPQLRSNSSSLGQETDLAQAYLSIMQMRMGPRLSFAIDVPPDLRAHHLPPMLLMSLVENAVKHGLEPLAQGGTIRIEAREVADRLTIAVTDNGRGLADKVGNGVGLSNLRGRLKALYGDRARFTLVEVAPHGARANIELPYDAQ